MSDPLEIRKSIKTIQHAAQSMQRWADAMEADAVALEHINDPDRRSPSETGLNTFNVNGINMSVKYKVKGMEAAEQRLVDAVAHYLTEHIRVLYEQIEGMRDSV